MFQTVDFHVGFWNIRTDPLAIRRIEITDADHAPAFPETACKLSRDAPPLW